MKVDEIMTRTLFTCAPDTEIVALAQMMASHGISGVPVVDEDRLVGIVTEGDLLRREEVGDTAAAGSWWDRLLSQPESPGAYVKSHGRYVADVMTANVTVVKPDATLHCVIELLEKHRIKRVPVVDEEKRLVGIVSRANFVKAIASVVRADRSTEDTSDDAIQSALTDELATHNWWQGGINSLTVSDGTVHFWGYYDNREQLAAARVVAENTAGVVDVEEHRIRYPMVYT